MSARVLPFPSRRIEARRRAERGTRDVALAVTAHLPSVPRCCKACGHVNNDLHDARTGRRSPFTGILRWIDRAFAIRAPLQIVLFGIEVVREYAHLVYGVDPHARQPTPPVARGERVTSNGTVLRKVA